MIFTRIAKTYNWDEGRIHRKLTPISRCKTQRINQIIVSPMTWCSLECQFFIQNEFHKGKHEREHNHTLILAPYYHQCDHDDDVYLECKSDFYFSYSKHLSQVQLQKDQQLQQCLCPCHVRDMHSCHWDTVPENMIVITRDAAISITSMGRQ